MKYEANGRENCATVMWSLSCKRTVLQGQTVDVTDGGNGDCLESKRDLKAVVRDDKRSCPGSRPAEGAMRDSQS